MKHTSCWESHTNECIVAGTAGIAKSHLRGSHVCFSYYKFVDEHTYWLLCECTFFAIGIWSSNWTNLLNCYGNVPLQNSSKDILSWVSDSQQFRIDGRPKLLPDASTSCTKCRWSKLPRNNIWRSYNEPVVVKFSVHLNNWIYIWVAGVELSFSLQSASVIIKMLNWVDQLLRATALINYKNEYWRLIKSMKNGCCA